MKAEGVGESVHLSLHQVLEVGPAAGDRLVLLGGRAGAPYVDSVGLTELLAFIESEFSVGVPEADLLSDEFVTIDGIARVVVRLAD